MSFVHRKASVKHNYSATASVLTTKTKSTLSFDGEVWANNVVSADVFSVDVDIAATTSS